MNEGASSALFDAVEKDDIERARALLIDVDDDDIVLEEVNEDNYSLLHLAVLKGNVDMVNLLIETGADPSATIEDDDTYVHLAAQTGNKELVELFLKYVDINFCNNLNRTALHVAVIKSKYDVAELLLVKGAEPNTCDITTRTPLHDAVKYNCRRGELISLLLNHQADPNILSGGSSAFHESFSILNEDLLNLFLDMGACAVSRNKQNYNALQLAASHSTPDIVEILLETDMDVNVYRYGERRAIHLAIIHNHHSEQVILTILRLLIEYEPEFDAVDARGETPLYCAAEKNYIQIVEYLLELGADIENNGGGRPLFAAVANGHIEMVEFLINKGATTLGVTNAMAENVMHIAIKQIKDRDELRYNMVKLLLEKGVDPNNHTNSFTSVIHLALETKDLRLFNLLIEHGALVNVKDRSNESLLHVACRSNLNDIARDLIINVNINVNINETNKYGESPLSISAFNNNVELFMFLLNNGANADHEAVSEASYKGHINIMKLLITHGSAVEYVSTDSTVPTIIRSAIRGCKSDMLLNVLDIGYSNYCHEKIKLYFDEACDMYQNYYFLQFIEEENSIKLILIEHIALLLYSKYSLPERVTALMLQMGFTQEHCTSCIVELERMKETKISDNYDVTYYDFLTKRENALVKCLRNEQIKAALEAGAYNELFPRYFNKLKVHYSNGLLRLRMMDEFESILESIFKKKNLPATVIREISEYFNYKDFVKCYGRDVIYNIVTS